MVKPKTGKFKNKSFNLGLSDEEYEDHVDASAAEYLYEAADRYHENEERVAAEKLAKLTKRPQRFVRVSDNPMMVLHLLMKIQYYRKMFWE